ncbi:MAG: helix-turn-helix domain-containing protein [Kordia sp.]|nr:helix-turn-helix domain-containing protein [Kordia sp.]
MFRALLIIPICIASYFFIRFNIQNIQKKTKSSLLLGSYFGIFILLLLTMVFVADDFENQFLISLINYLSLMFYVGLLAVPPIIYLYVLSLSDLNYKAKEKPIIHFFLPLILFVINTLCFFYLTFSQDQESFSFEVSVVVMNYSNYVAILFIFPLINIYYIYSIFKAYSYYTKRSKEIYSYYDGISIRWILHFVIGYIIFILSTYVINSISGKVKYIPFIVFLMSYLLFVGIRGMRQKKAKLLALEENSKVNQQDPVGKKKMQKVQKNETLINDISIAMEVEEAYLNNTLTIYEFSKMVNSNSKYVSQILNSEFGQNFSSYVNSFRVEKSKKLLVSNQYKNYTIEAISEKVGFKSKSAFNNAFKNIAGMTPSVYRKKQKVDEDVMVG